MIVDTMTYEDLKKELLKTSVRIDSYLRGYINKTRYQKYYRATLKTRDFYHIFKPVELEKLRESNIKHYLVIKSIGKGKLFKNFYSVLNFQDKVFLVSYPRFSQHYGIILLQRHALDRFEERYLGIEPEYEEPIMERWLRFLREDGKMTLPLNSPSSLIIGDAKSLMTETGLILGDYLDEAGEMFYGKTYITEELFREEQESLSEMNKILTTSKGITGINTTNEKRPGSLGK